MAGAAVSASGPRAVARPGALCMVRRHEAERRRLAGRPAAGIAALPVLPRPAGPARPQVQPGAAGTLSARARLPRSARVFLLYACDKGLPHIAPMQPMPWNIRRQGRAWTASEAPARWALTPEKIEMLGGKLFLTDEERLTMLGLLLENVGADAAVHLGDPEVWREAVAALPHG